MRTTTHHTTGDLTDRPDLTDTRVVAAPAEREVVVSDGYIEEPSVVAPVARFLALAAAAFLTIVGLVACADIDWGAGLDAPAVGVLDMPFTPITAVAVTVLGLLAIGVAVTRVGDGRLVMGAILACIGVAILVADGISGDGDLQLIDRHGWLLLGVGAVLGLAGLAAPGRMRRVVRRDDVVAGGTPV